MVISFEQSATLNNLIYFEESKFFSVTLTQF